MQTMRQTVEQHGMKPWIAKEDLKHALRRGVAPEYSIDLLPDNSEHDRLLRDAAQCAEASVGSVITGAFAPGGIGASISSLR